MGRWSLLFALVLLFVGVTRGARADEPPVVSAASAPSAFAVGMDGWGGFLSRYGSPRVVAGYGLYGRYRLVPYLSLGGAVTRLIHTDHESCQDNVCASAPASLFGLTARYHGSSERTFEPWIQLALGLGISEESSFTSGGGGAYYYALDRVAVRPWFEGKAGFDLGFAVPAARRAAFAFMAIGLDARVIGFGDPTHIFPGLGVHLEGRW